MGVGSILWALQAVLCLQPSDCLIVSKHMGRVKEWIHPDGVHHTPAALALWMTPFAAAIFRAGPHEIYDPTHRSQPKDSSTLDRWAEFLAAALLVDPRGAYFNQDHMREALELLVIQCEMDSVVSAWVSKFPMSRHELMDLLALKIKVMLAHARAGWGKEETEGSTCSSSRPHPFLMFRASPTEEADSEPEEEIEQLHESILVSRLWNGKKAQQLFSDGKVLDAVKYVQGETGFAQAIFADGSSLPLEVLNAQVDDSGQLLAAPSPKAKAKAKALPKKRPAAVAFSHNIRLKVCPGHKGSSVAFLVAPGGKAQVLQVVASKEYNARDICEFVCNELQDALKALPDVPFDKLKEEDLVNDFRTTAQAMREQILAPFLNKKASCRKRHRLRSISGLIFA